MKIWKRAAHNAFTDLIFFKGSFFCCFREGDGHVEKKPGTITLLKSKTGKSWKEIASLSYDDWDLRDPFLSVTPTGELLLNVECCQYPKDKTPIRFPAVAFSKGGKKWGKFIPVKLPGEWIWRITWHEEKAYAFSYNPHKKPWTLHLVTSADGKNFKIVQKIRLPHSPSEATIRFLPSGEALALVRTKRKAYLIQALPPYKKWKSKETRFRTGGPNFLILPDGTKIAAMRCFINKKPKTALFEIGSTGLKRLQVLPSGGDTSYGGMVYNRGKLYISYYSSHEGKAAIYFATTVPSKS